MGCTFCATGTMGEIGVILMTLMILRNLPNLLLLLAILACLACLALLALRPLLSCRLSQDLTMGEIVEQLIHARRYSDKISNVVFMGKS
jgi:uncharacterized membrane protein